MLTEAARARIHQATIDRLMAGESGADLFKKLRSKLSEADAKEIVDAAELQYAAIATSSGHDDNVHQEAERHGTTATSIDESAVEKDLLEQLVRGETSEALFQNLRSTLGDGVARDLILKVQSEYEAAKKSGRLGEIEYQTFFKPDEKTSPADKAALGAILAGVVLTAISYAVAAPGETYLIFWGLIALGVFRLLYSGIRGWPPSGGRFVF